MSTYVLVHGAWHGAWCWYKIVPRLRRDGHTVVTLDLPAHGTDRTPVEQVTLQTQVDHVGAVLDEADEPVVLVGHSAGGVVITETAEQYPEDVDTLVYVSAFLLPDGTSLLDVNQNDEESLVPPNLEVDEEEGHAMVREDALEETFYADCDEEEVTLCKSLLRPEPMATFSTPVETTDEGFGSIPRIVCVYPDVASGTA